MSQEDNEQGVSKINQNGNDYMSTVKTNMKDSSSNFPSFKDLYQLKKQEAAKLELIKLAQKQTSLELVQATFMDKIILSLIKEQKLKDVDYRYLFYVFFKRQYYHSYYENLGHQKLGKFFKKFFNAFTDENRGGNEALSNCEIGEFINYYIYELYDLLLGHGKSFIINNSNDIRKLPKEKIIGLKNLSKEDYKYLKFLIKYILALCNKLKNKKPYENYHLAIYETFININHPIFQNYFRKQLYKICINKGVYKYDNKFFLNIFYDLIYEDNKIKRDDFSEEMFNILEKVLSYKPKYYIDNINNINENNKDIEEKSPFYFLNMAIVVKIMNDLLINNKASLKAPESFNGRINLFSDNNTQMGVAEFLLTDNINGKIIQNLLDNTELIKPYIENMEKLNNNNKYWKYFEYLFFDLSMNIFLQKYYNKKISQKNNTNNQLNTTLSSSYILKSPSKEIKFNFLNNNNNNTKEEKLDYEKITINKFLSSQDYFIRKYFCEDLIDEDNIEIILEQKTLEELFVLLDIIYNISNKFNESVVIKKSIEDIKKIITHIINKSYKKQQFNSTIFNFILNIDKKYLPSADEFDIIHSNANILFNESFSQFIKTYPLYIIFIINYFSSRDNNIKEFLHILKAFMEGYSTDVINKIDLEYSHTLQLNYLYVIYFIIKQMIKINLDKINEIDVNNYLMLHLPYCINCKKKIKNNIILSKYLSQCFYCGEKHLYINTNIFKYLIKHKNDIGIFLSETAYKVLENITWNILINFHEKFEKKNDVPLFCYSLYYKMMKEHFQFLNDIQFITGKDIPFENEKNNLEEKIKFFFENYITNKYKYPFGQIYKVINDDNFTAFNAFRKTIKHESILANNEYIPLKK